MATRLPGSEYADRLEAVRDRIAEQDDECWFDATSNESLTGFRGSWTGT